VRENHYKQCWYEQTGECVCRAIQEAMEAWDEYTERELDAQRVRGRREGCYTTTILFAALSAVLIAVWIVL